MRKMVGYWAGFEWVRPDAGMIIQVNVVVVVVVVVGVCDGSLWNDNWQPEGEQIQIWQQGQVGW